MNTVGYLLRPDHKDIIKGKLFRIIMRKNRVRMGFATFFERRRLNYSLRISNSHINKQFFFFIKTNYVIFLSVNLIISLVEAINLHQIHPNNQTVFFVQV